MIAGFGDELGGGGGLCLGLCERVSGRGEGGRHVEGEAGALQRQVSKVEPHLLAGDVLDLGEVGADALDQARLASRGTPPPMRRSGEKGEGEEVDRAGLSQTGDCTIKIPVLENN